MNTRRSSGETCIRDGAHSAEAVTGFGVAGRYRNISTSIAAFAWIVILALGSIRPVEAKEGRAEGVTSSSQQWQLVFGYDETAVTLLSASEIPPLNKRSKTPGLEGAIATVSFAVDWLDPSGRSMHTGTIELPLGQRLFLGPDLPCETMIPKEGVIVVRSDGPAAKARLASLRLHRIGEKSRTSSFAEIPASLTRPEISLPVQRVNRVGSKIAPPPGPFSVAKIQDTGIDGNRLVLVFLGDGYTAANLSSGDFANDAQAALAAFDAKSPWDVIFGGTNVYRVDVESNQQGADREDGPSGTMVDTYFNSSFWTSGIDRLLAIDFTGRLRAINAADTFVGPGVWDYLFVLVNSTVYGGSGGTIGVSSVHPSASEVIIHEFGHTFAGLADEYTSPYPGYPAGDSEPNVDFDYTLADLKWSAWVDAGTPLPTPDTSTYNAVVGAFQGARYLTSGIYRPARNCLMRSLGTGFCSICKEAHMIDYFNRVALADALTPAAGTTVTITPAGQLFSVSPLSIPGIAYQWAVDGIPMSGGTGSSVTVYPSDVPGETATLRVAVSYPTSLVRGTTFSDLYSWTIGADADTTAPTASISLIDSNPTNADSVHFAVQFSERVDPTFDASDITVTGTLAAGAAVTVTGSDPDFTVTVTPTNPAGNGTIGITIGTGITDQSGNPYAGGSAPAVYTIQNIGPTISAGAPTATLTSTGPVSYTITYGGANSVTLAPGDVSLVSTGTAAGAVGVSGSGTASRVVTVSGITGNGTLSIAIAAGTATDVASNPAPSLPSTTAFTVDNTAPTMQSALVSGSLSVDVTFTEALGPSALVSSNYVVSGTGRGTLSTNPSTVSLLSGNTYQLTWSTGEMRSGGNVTITASNIQDMAGVGIGVPNSRTHTAGGIGFPPLLSIDAPTPAVASSGPITFLINLSGASAVALSPAYVQLNPISGAVSGTIAVTGSGLTSRTVVVSGISGTGVAGITIGAGAASDAAGNTSAVTSSSGAAEIDNTPPVITALGQSIISVEQGTPFTDPGATAQDNREGDITARINCAGGVDTGQPNTYVVTYSVSDNLGNAATPVERTVIVYPSTPPGVPIEQSTVVFALTLAGLAAFGMENYRKRKAR